jgi:hypothetical protein
MTLEIIGPGFGRTGTSSLKTALEHLGYGPTHHMFEVRDNPANPHTGKPLLAARRLIGTLFLQATAARSTGRAPATGGSLQTSIPTPRSSSPSAIPTSGTIASPPRSSS